MNIVTIKALNNLYQTTYDNTADEYEERVEKLRKVTEEALDVFLKHVKPGGRILDVGCAVGYTTEIMLSKGYAVDGIDISPKMVRYAQKRNPAAKILVGDLMVTDFVDSYDGIVAFAFIHLFPKSYAIKYINKMRQLLSKNGVMFLTTTRSEVSSEGLEEKADYTNKVQRYRKRWTQPEFDETLESLDLEIIERIFPEDAMGKVWMDYVVRPKG